MKLRLDSEGLVEGTRFIPSPNCDERSAGCAINLLVVHYISLPPGEFGGPAIIEFFTNRLDPAAHPFYPSIAGTKVSAHFVIRRDGEIIQFVPCVKRAWHAGESSWKGRTRCNDYSIGVELEGTGDVPFTDAQYEQLAELTIALKGRFPIADIVGHSDVAPGRKSDPGPQFDWARYRAMLKDKAEPRRTRRTQEKVGLNPHPSSLIPHPSTGTAKTPRRRDKAKKK